VDHLETFEAVYEDRYEGVYGPLGPHVARREEGVVEQLELKIRKEEDAPPPVRLPAEAVRKVVTLMATTLLAMVESDHAESTEGQDDEG